MGRLGYVPALDGIRAVAILSVLGYHYFLIPRGGTVGVDVFFVLSGFLITTLLLEERFENGRVSLRAFYVRRARRLFPALAVMISIYLALSTIAGSDRLLAAVLSVFYVGNLVDAYGHTRLLVDANLDSLWSLAQEEQFYVLWPCALLLLTRTRRMLLWVGLIAGGFAVYRAILVMGGNPSVRTYYSPDTHADGLLIGATLAVARLRWHLQVGEWAGKVGAAALVPALIVGWQFTAWAVWVLPVFEICVALLIAAAVSGTELAACLSARPFVWLGKRSYGLYLWHGPVFAATVYVLGSSSPDRLVGAAAAIGAASLSYRFVELPFRRRRKTSAEPRAREAAPSAAASSA
jgi:peptidoglycan/LPS O-acetylase OafA/YrhL